MARRARGKVFKLEYRSPLGDVIRYVDRREEDLLPEYIRVRTAILDAVRIINSRSLKRLKNVVLDITRFQLTNSLKPISDTATAQELVAEITRLSFIMEDAVKTLARLSNSRVDHLQDLRFRLTYGQTPRRRDLTEQLPSEVEDNDSKADSHE